MCVWVWVEVGVGVLVREKEGQPERDGESVCGTCFVNNY